MTQRDPQLLPLLNPLHVASPCVITSESLSTTDPRNDTDSSLARNRISIRPFPAATTLESGSDRTDGQWRVLHTYNGLLCIKLHYVLEFVQLKRANFGFRWRATNLEGNTDVLPPSCMIGPHWHIMLITWSIFFITAFCINALTFRKASGIELAAGLVVSGLCLVCYALVACSNPGIVQSIQIPPDDTYTYCDHCESYRPERALHCMDCRVCIEEYDHHCPWTGKCVGKGNVRYFYWWLLLLVLAFVYEVIEFATYVLPPDGPLLSA